MQMNFRINFNSGKSKFVDLDLYSGSQSMLGFSQILLISLNAYFNFEFISKATAAKGFHIAMGRSKAGSWDQLIHLIVESPDVLATLRSLGDNALYELLKWSILGVVVIPFSVKLRKAKQHIRDLQKQNDDLQDHLHEAARRAHAPVKYQGLSVTLFQGRRAIVTLNEETLQFLEEEVVQDDSELLDVVVSRFNARTGTGRVIDNMEAQSIAFYPEENLSAKAKQRLSNSLNDLTHGVWTDVNICVRRITTRDGRTKRYLLQSVI